MQVASVTQWLEDIGVREPKLQLFAAYWDQLRGSRSLPRRQDIDPWHIAALLPHIWLWGVEPGSVGSDHLRFVLGLAGEEICRLIDRHRRGTPLTKAISPSAYPSVLKRYTRIVEETSAAYFIGTAMLANGFRLPAQWLILPLSRNDDNVTDIIGVTLFRRDTLKTTGGEIRFTDEEVRGRFLPLLDKRHHHASNSPASRHDCPMPAATSG